MVERGFNGVSLQLQHNPQGRILVEYVLTMHVKGACAIWLIELTWALHSSHRWFARGLHRVCHRQRNHTVLRELDKGALAERLGRQCYSLTESSTKLLVLSLKTALNEAASVSRLNTTSKEIHMATRATYQFISEWSGTHTAYIHHDGYPEGAAQYLLKWTVASRFLTSTLSFATQPQS